MLLININKAFLIYFVFLSISCSAVWAQMGVNKIPQTQASYYFGSDNFSLASQYFNLIDFYPSLSEYSTAAGFYKIATDLRLNRPGAEKKLSAFMT